jgi:hypothetical protein
LENERTYVTGWALEDLARFVKKLRPTDEVSVEITSNTRLFYDAVAPHVARIVVVDTNHISRLDVLMYEAMPMDLAECCRQANSNAQEVGQIERLFLAALKN